jgi:hypothetical protein
MIRLKFSSKRNLGTGTVPATTVVTPTATFCNGGSFVCRSVSLEVRASSLPHGFLGRLPDPMASHPILAPRGAAAVQKLPCQDRGGIFLNHTRRNHASSSLSLYGPTFAGSIFSIQQVPRRLRFLAATPELHGAPRKCYTQGHSQRKVRVKNSRTGENQRWCLVHKTHHSALPTSLSWPIFSSLLLQYWAT